MLSSEDWKCVDCGYVGPCEYREDRNPSEFWGQPVVEVLMVDMSCSECGSEDVEKH